MSQFLQTFPLIVTTFDDYHNIAKNALKDYFQQYPKAYELAKDKNRTVHMIHMACKAKKLVCTEATNSLGQYMILFTKQKRKMKTKEEFIEVLKSYGWKF